MLWLAAIGLLAGLTVLFQVAQPGRGGVVKSVEVVIYWVEGDLRGRI